MFCLRPITSCSGLSVEGYLGGHIIEQDLILYLCNNTFM